MANIKQAFDQAPDARPMPTPYSDVPYSPEGFGSDTGSAIQQTAAQLGDVYRRAKENADATAVIGAIGQARAALNTVILDPKGGYVATKGTDAITDRDKYLGKFNDAVEAAEGSLTNEDQRRAFSRHAQVIQEEGVRHVYSHEAVQQDDVAKAAFAGTADQAIRSMQWEIDKPDQIQKHVNDLRDIATAEGVRRFGNNPQAVQSVVAPTMQKAAIDGMEAAVASNDPQLAKGAFEKLSPYLLNHEQHYASLVRTLDQRQSVNTQAAQVVAGAVTSTLVPGGAQVPRLDATKLSTAVLNLPDGPLRDQVVKAIEQRQVVLDKIWDQTKAQQVAAAETQGTDAQSGAFSLDRVSPSTKLWLQRNAPDKLIALRALDARAQRIDSGEDKRISAGNYNALTAETIDPTLRKQKFAQMTPEEFTSYLRDEDRFPGGFSKPDEARALRQFKDIKTAAGKIEEPIPSAVSEVLKAALPNDPNTSKKYIGALHDAVQQFVDDYKERHKGVAPSSQEVREFGLKEMAKGSVTPIGTAPGAFDFNSVRRIDFEQKPDFGGKQFNPKEGGEPAFRRVRLIGPGGRFTLPESQVDEFLKSDKGKGFRRG